MHLPLPFLLAASLLAPPAADTGGRGRSLAVAVAANLKPAFEEIAAAWKARHPGLEVRATYGGSGNFYSQIANGAPFDLFLSADAEFPARIAERGLADGAAFTYGYGRLVAWVPKGSPVDLERRGLAALADPAVKRIAIPNPRLAPYGRAAEAALRAAGVYPAVKDRLVMGENVSQAAQFVQSGNADVGFLPLSLTRTAPLSGGRTFLVPPAMHAPIEQGGAVLRGSKELDLARDLAAFVLGPEGRAVLSKYGYDLPPR